MCPARFNVAVKIGLVCGAVGLDQGNISCYLASMELLCLRCYNKPPFAITSDFISISRMVRLDNFVPRARA